MSYSYPISANQYQSKGPDATNAKALMESFNALPALFQEGGKKRRLEASLALKAMTTAGSSSPPPQSSSLNNNTQSLSPAPGFTTKRKLGASSVWDAGKRKPGTPVGKDRMRCQSPKHDDDDLTRTTVTTPSSNPTIGGGWGGDGRGATPASTDLRHTILQSGGGSRQGRGVAATPAPLGRNNTATVVLKTSSRGRRSRMNTTHSANTRRICEGEDEEFFASPSSSVVLSSAAAAGGRVGTPFQQLKQPPEGLLSASAFEQRQTAEYSNLFPSTKEESTLRPTTKAAIKAQTSKPGFLQELELKIEAELSALRDHGGSSNARARLYLEVLGQLGEHLPTYQPIMTALMKEMTGILQEAETQQMKAVRAQSDYAELRTAYDTDTHALKVELSESELRMRSELERIDTKQKQRSMVMLIYDVEELERQVVESKATIKDLQGKLVATNRVRAEFERTMRSIEDTFNLISDEKDLQISKLRTEAAMEHAEGVGVKRKAHAEITALSDRVDTVTIAHRVCSRQNVLLTDRCKDQGSHLNTIVQKLQAVESERDAMEERLAVFEGTPQAGVRNPTTTPRPSKAETLKRIPTLGEIKNFGSTASMMVAIYELHDQLQRQISDWQKLYDTLDQQVESRFKERMLVEAERSKVEAAEKKRLLGIKKEAKRQEMLASRAAKVFDEPITSSRRKKCNKKQVRRSGDSAAACTSGDEDTTGSSDTTTSNNDSDGGDDFSEGGRSASLLSSGSMFCDAEPPSKAMSILGRPRVH